MIEPPFRRAAPEDAKALAELIDFAGQGLPTYLWAKMAEPGETVWEVGQRRARRDEGSFSWRNAVMLEEGGEAVATLMGYLLPEAAEPIPADLPAIFVPLQELENEASGTWYVNVLATYPQHRGRGHGTALLALAERLAAEVGGRGLSIIVSNGNPGALRLYERCGYRRVAERPIVKEGWQGPGTAWLLLTKPG
jgi:ribosomal protein S18 acetylase RimI-like enzyme